MNYKIYRIGAIARLSAGGDCPAVCSDVQTAETPTPIYSNGIDNEGLYGYTDKARIEGDTVTVSARGVNIGTVFYRKEAFLPIVRLISVIPDRSIVDAKYLYYYLRGVELGGTGSAQPQIPVPFLEKKKITIHEDVNVQKRIADFLSKYDLAIELNTKRIKTLEQMAENLYKEWFVRFRFPGHENAEFENGIPKGWEIKRLNTIADIVMGQSPESSLYNMEKQGLPFHQGVGSYGEYYLRDEVYSTGGNKIANPNSIIFSVRAPVGRINITLNTIILGRGVASINSKTDNNGFLYWLLKFKFHQEDLIGNGSIFSSVTKKELDNQKFIIPPKDIIQRFDDFAKMIEKNMRVLYLNNENLIKQRNLLLPRLMSGKLEV